MVMRSLRFTLNTSFDIPILRVSLSQLVIPFWTMIPLPAEFRPDGIFSDDTDGGYSRDETENIHPERFRFVCTHPFHG